MLKRLFDEWKDKLVQSVKNKALKHAEKEARQLQTRLAFNDFLNESEPLTPKATKHKEAALYRHAWKRAVVLEVLSQRQGSKEKVELYKDFQQLASDLYYKVAPETLYGKAKLRLASDAGSRLFAEEVDRLRPKAVEPKSREDACIYIGICPEGIPYIGQTLLSPENRWKQHKLEKTGPFKKGAQYVKWEVLEGPVSPWQLDARESYFIGLHDSYANGHNDTRGNDAEAYQLGQSHRVTR